MSGVDFASRAITDRRDNQAVAALLLARASDPSLKFQRLWLTFTNATSSGAKGISLYPRTSMMQPSLATTWSKNLPSLSSTETT